MNTAACRHHHCEIQTYWSGINFTANFSYMMYVITTKLRFRVHQLIRATLESQKRFSPKLPPSPTKRDGPKTACDASEVNVGSIVEIRSGSAGRTSIPRHSLGKTASALRSGGDSCRVAFSRGSCVARGGGKLAAMALTTEGCACKKTP